MIISVKTASHKMAMRRGRRAACGTYFHSLRSLFSVGTSCFLSNGFRAAVSIAVARKVSQAPQDHPIDGLDIRSVLKGDWKHVKAKNKEQLFNLAEDRDESKKPDQPTSGYGGRAC